MAGAAFAVALAVAPAPAAAQVTGAELLRWCQGALSSAPTALSDAFQCTTYLQAVLDEVRPPGALDRCLEKPGLSATDLMAQVLPVLEGASADADRLSGHARDLLAGWMQEACGLTDPLGDAPVPEPPEATDCDRLASHPSDPRRVAAPIEFDNLDAPAAIRACQAALETDPENPRLMTLLGRSFEKARQYEAALEVNRRAAELSYLGAFHNLGNLYRKGGPGVEQDLGRAMEYYRRAALLGHAEDQYNLGVMYLEGKPVEQDYVEAVGWFQRSADQGWAPAMDRLGTMYRNGWGVEQTPEEAYRLYLMAAEVGRASAMVHLGELLLDGEAVTQDYEEARHWFERAADLDNHAALDNLGNLYRNGLGVTADPIEAYKWYRLAEARGNLAAKRKLDALAAEIGPEGVAEGEQRAEEWLSRRFG